MLQGKKNRFLASPEMELLLTFFTPLIYAPLYYSVINYLEGKGLIGVGGYPTLIPPNLRMILLGDGNSVAELDAKIGVLTAPVNVFGPKR